MTSDPSTSEATELEVMVSCEREEKLEVTDDDSENAVDTKSNQKG